ncbi:hypothetical protein LTR08_003774 [Meristemomyces frigidus]|nr:hypothetical protein LTR08_003774 [Meristemomyces frigidus]
MAAILAIIAAPVYWLVGFGHLGPVAGGLAAFFQSVFGTPAIFAFFQAGAMVGAAAGAAANGVIAGAVAAVALFAASYKLQQGCCYLFFLFLFPLPLQDNSLLLHRTPQPPKQNPSNNPPPNIDITAHEPTHLSTPPAMDDAAKTALEAAKATYGKLVGGLEHITWAKLPEPVKQYLRAHPKATAAQVVLAIIFVVPGLVLTPALGALGFTSIGPAAGKCCKAAP